MQAATALIAEDEPLLAQALQAELARAWPTLTVLATVGDGASAVRQALALQPDVLFFDIRMPGQTGLDAAVELAEHAIDGFDLDVVDYLLKPVQPQRLQKTVEKLALALAKPTQHAINFEATLGQLRGLLAGPATAPKPPLQVIQASVGSTIRMVPVDEVLCFEAADKYVRVLTAEREYLIRTPLKELLEQLDPQTFWQVHRGTVVQAAAIDTVVREEAGRLSITRCDNAQMAPNSLYYVK